MNKSDIQAVIELYKQGLSMRDVAKQIGITGSKVFYHVHEAGASRTLSEARRLAHEHGKLPQKGPHNPNWRGGRYIHKDGYVRVWNCDHPRRHKRDNHVLEHILVWERVHKKPLPEGWVIHHINGIKSDNRPSNLRALPASKHDELALLHEAQKRIRELEVENRILQRALENSQSIFQISEN